MQKELKVGDKLCDNDPRRVYLRILTITQILPNGVYARTDSGKTVGLLRHRIFTDGKPRRYGYNLLDDNGETK